jgi:hypothetical protein
MVYLEVKHTVADYAKWRKVFDNHEATRRSFGATGVKQVFRGLENPNSITTLIQWDTAENAQRFSQDQALKGAMAEGGVVSAPEATFLNLT